MVDIRIPTLNSNDVVYLLLDWLVEDGDAVDAGRPIAVVETSKATEELVADTAGVLSRLLPSGSQCSPGSVIGRISASGEAGATPEAPSLAPADGHTDAGSTAGAAGVLVTEPARQVAAEIGVDVQRLRQLGLAVVRRADVLRLAGMDRAAGPAGAEAADELVLPRSQAGVASVVTRSRATIPSAFVAVKVAVDEAAEFARAATRRLKTLVGLPEVVLAALGRLGREHPLCFAAPAGEHTLRAASAVNVAVTVDVGTGLYLPVVRGCDTRGIGEIARDLMAHRLTSIRGRFRENDLAGGAMLLSLGHDEVVANHPIIPPGMVCAISLTGVQREPVLRPDTGTLGERSYVIVGATYDHRYVNGADATRLLIGIKGILERRPRLDDL
ncbi:2-oxo acid dehydrogenase subunit E2 [Dactylosporangium sp. CA-139066]|uniref:2-oxo acid dehydrogenase subunit E2 n=1 Tax=Dactylosporangium sp. CA-139066 TaxID=3239930 RepID=UPI003D92ED13